MSLDFSTMSSHDHVTLLIWNLLNTPLHVYKRLRLPKIEVKPIRLSVVR
jgi:hypothetical protein